MTRIRHIAIVSDQYALQGRFYEAIFGMRAAEDKRPERAVTVSDGYVGLNINPRKPGRTAGLDHFGFEVDDADAACAKLAKFAGAHFVKRPSTRPFAGISANDPAGNIFDISQKDGKTQLTFTHIGLVPAYECYQICADAWGNYVGGSLKSLIETGKGNPNPYERAINNAEAMKGGQHE